MDYSAQIEPPFYSFFPFWVPFLGFEMFKITFVGFKLTFVSLCMTFVTFKFTFVMFFLSFAVFFLSFAVFFLSFERVYSINCVKKDFLLMFHFCSMIIIICDRYSLYFWKMFQEQFV